MYIVVTDLQCGFCAITACERKVSVKNLSAAAQNA
jgi:hypothetical protein